MKVLVCPNCGEAWGCDDGKVLLLCVDCPMEVWEEETGSECPQKYSNDIVLIHDVACLALKVLYGW